MPEHLLMMKHALECSTQARTLSPPAPWIGCVIADEEKIIAQACSEHSKGEHAEVLALSQVRDRNLEAATMYLTLEPCCHRGRTPPCIDAIIESGIRHVVIATQDPDENLRGRGIAQLREKGLDVEVGVLENEIKHELRSYFHHRRHKRSYTVLTITETLDGCLPTHSKDQWISSKESIDKHLMRNESQAIVVDARTILKSNPLLTVRHSPLQGKAPLRVIIDRDDIVPINAQVFQTKTAPTLCITSGNVNRNKLLLKQGVETLSWNKPGHISCRFIQQELAKRDVLQMLVEGEGITMDSFIREQAFHELIIYVRPQLAGKAGHHLSTSLPNLHLPALHLKKTLTLEDTVCLHYVK